MSICKVLFPLFRGLLVSRSDLILENLALRQQMTIQQRTIKRPKLKNKDRIFWSWLSQIWPDWKSNLINVKPETVIKSIARASNYIGVGNRSLIRWDDQKSVKKSEM